MRPMITRSLTQPAPKRCVPAMPSTQHDEHNATNPNKNRLAQLRQAVVLCPACAMVEYRR